MWNNLKIDVKLCKKKYCSIQEENFVLSIVSILGRYRVKYTVVY